MTLDGVEEITINAKQGETGPAGKDGKDGIDGKDGVDGKDGKDGVDGKDGINGKDGIDGLNGKDGKDGVDGKDGSPDTPEQIVDKLESLKEHLDYNKLKNLPNIEAYLARYKQASKTVSLQELDNVDLTDTTTTNGKYVIGSGLVESVVAGTNITVDNTDPKNPIISSTGGGGGTAWGSITGTLSNQTDLQTVLDTKATKAYATAMAIALG